MNATKTTIITVEIKGQKIELTEAEARELASSLNGLLGIPEMIREPWPIEPFQPLPSVPYRTPPKWQPSITPNRQHDLQGTDMSLPHNVQKLR